MNSNKHLQLDQSYYFKRLHAHDIQNILRNINQQENKDTEKLQELILSKYSEIISSISLLKQIDTQTKDINSIIKKECENMQRINSNSKQTIEQCQPEGKMSNIDQALNILERREQYMSPFYNFYMRISENQHSIHKFLLIQKEIQENWIHQSLRSKEDFMSLLLMIKQILIGDIESFYSKDVNIDCDYLKIVKDIFVKIDKLTTKQVSLSTRQSLIKQCFGFTANDQNNVNSQDLLSKFIIQNLQSRCFELFKPQMAQQQQEEELGYNQIEELNNRIESENSIFNYLSYQRIRRRIFMALQQANLTIPSELQVNQNKVSGLIIERIKQTLQNEQKCNNQTVVAILQSDEEIPGQIKTIIEQHLNDRVMSKINQIILQITQPLLDSEQLSIMDSQNIKLNLIILEEYLTFQCGSMLNFNFFWDSLIEAIDFSKIKTSIQGAKVLIQSNAIKLLKKLSKENESVAQKLKIIKNSIEQNGQNDEDNKYLKLIIQ